MLRNATTRLIAVHLVLVVLSTTGVLGFLYWSTNDLIDGEVRKVVDTELAGLADDYRSLGVLGLARAIERRGKSERDAVYLLTDATGRRLAGNLRAWPSTVEPGAGWIALELRRVDRDASTLIEAASIRLRGGERLLVGRDAQARDRFRQALTRAAAQALAGAVLLSLLTGWLLSRFILGRIGEIDRTASEIISGEFGRRVPVRGTGDEFDRLSGTLNRMLARIESLVDNLRMTTDSLAHDLRSPLMRLRAHMGDLAAPGLDETAREDIVARAEAETEHLLRTFTSLIQVSRAEAGLGRDDFTTLDLDRLVMDAVDLYQPAAADKAVMLRRIGTAMPVHGHAQLVTLALSNLLENALRHAPPGSEIVIALRASRDSVSLSVTDRGPGIPATDRDRVLQRFVMLGKDRKDGAGGLGLALVAAIARLHDAAIHLDDNAPGLIVTLRFPRFADSRGTPPLALEAGSGTAGVRPSGGAEVRARPTDG